MNESAFEPGKIEMMSIQRAKPGNPPRYCALAFGAKQSAFGDTEEEARLNAIALIERKPA